MSKVIFEIIILIIILAIGMFIISSDPFEKKPSWQDWQDDEEEEDEL